ncbi:MAG: alpha/beta fold hydrolase [Acidimicrobiia bacterium]
MFLHGIGGTGVYWSAVEGKSRLPPGATLVDLFGFGRSPRPLIRYTLDAHLSALEPILSTRAPSVLVGHSMGAALALAYATRHPEQVSGLVLISLPTYGGPEGARSWFRRRPQGWFFTNMVLTALACMTTRRLLGPLLPLILREIPREVARDLVEHNFMSSTTSLWEVLYKHDPAEDLRRLSPHIPVLFLHGDQDTTAPVEAVRQLAISRREARLVELKGVDHHPWLRDPGACAGTIAEWAAELGITWSDTEKASYERQG